MFYTRNRYKDSVLSKVTMLLINISLSNESNEGLSCGIIPGKFRHDGRYVFSSKNLTDNTWPWIVSLGHWENEDEERWIHSCGGSIITEHHILTAAHCAQIFDKSNWNVLLRINDFGVFEKKDDEDNLPDDHIRGVKNIFIHPYHDKNHVNASYFDVAILEVDEPFLFDPDHDYPVVPVCLPSEPYTEPDDYSGSSASFSGWGVLTYGDTDHSKMLRTGVVTIYSKIHCEDLHKSSPLREFRSVIEKLIPEGFQDDIFCAGNPETAESACFGDSGGPLVQFQGSKSNAYLYVQIGVIEGGVKCGEPDFPTIFVNLRNPDVLNFVRETAGLHKGGENGLNHLQCNEVGGCTKSISIGHSTQESFEACHQKCSVTNGCYWFTFESSNNLCLLFANCIERMTQDCESCVTSQVTCHSSS